MRVGLIFFFSIICAQITAQVFGNEWISYNQKYYASIEPNQMFDKFKDFTLNIDKVTGLTLSEVNPLLNQYMEKQNEYT